MTVCFMSGLDISSTPKALCLNSVVPFEVCFMGSSAAFVQMFDGMNDVPLQDVSQAVSVSVSHVVCDSQR